MQDDVEGIVYYRRFAFNSYVGTDGGRRSEKLHGLINQVDAEIEEYPAPRLNFLPPGSRTSLQPIAIEMCLVKGDSPQSLSFHQVADGAEVAIAA